MPRRAAAANVTPACVGPHGVTCVTSAPSESNRGNTGNSLALHARAVTSPAAEQVSRLCGHPTPDAGGRSHVR